MHALLALWQKMCVLILPCVIICVLVLTACGTNVSGIRAGSTPTPLSTTQTVRGYGTAYGCPSDVAVSTAPAAANVTLRPGQGSTTFFAHKGNIVEIQMPFGVAWVGPDISGTALELQSPAGYVWKQSNACVWRFVARNAGTVTLTFSGTALCKKPIRCVPSEVLVGFTIAVV